MSELKLEKLLYILLLILSLCLVGQIYAGIDFEKADESGDGQVVYRERTLTTDTAELPAAYDCREQQKAPTVKDQGTLGTCWAVTASSALESRLLPSEQLVFSADHLSMENSFQKDQSEGGDYTMIMAYLAGWQGPVLEADDPYGDGVSDGSLTAVKHVQEIQLLQDVDETVIKEAVYQYGAVQSSLYMDLPDAFSTSVYYNQLNVSYYYPGDETANHDVLIIGWDDNYPAEQFNAQTSRDGAFICQNSWGTEFGENGIFYVSYEDANLGDTVIVYTRIEPADNYDKIYQTDLCGWVGQLGYGDEDCYFANCFEAEEAGTLEAVGFYAVGPDSQYSIRILEEGEELTDALLAQEVAKGRLEQAGYYTISLDVPVSLDAGEKYTVVIKLHTPNTEYPVATEYAADEATAGADLSDGDGYISHNGIIWNGSESEFGCNVCMKVYLNLES